MGKRVGRLGGFRGARLELANANMKYENEDGRS